MPVSPQERDLHRARPLASGDKEEVGRNLKISDKWRVRGDEFKGFALILARHSSPSFGGLYEENDSDAWCACAGPGLCRAGYASGSERGGSWPRPFDRARPGHGEGFAEES